MSSTHYFQGAAQNIRMQMVRLSASRSAVHTVSYISTIGTNFLKQSGSAIYIFGDKVDDHGLFSVTLDNRTAQQFDGVSGCGGAFRKYCEKDNTLAYFASNLDSSLHTVTVQNNAGVNHSFFGEWPATNEWFQNSSFDIADLDAMVYTTPSEYAVRQPPMSSSGSGSSSSASISLVVPGMNSLLLFFLSAVWLGRSCRR